MSRSGTVNGRQDSFSNLIGILLQLKFIHIFYHLFIYVKILVDNFSYFAVSFYYRNEYLSIP
jgi:hypothetical protein